MSHVAVLFSTSAPQCGNELVNDYCLFVAVRFALLACAAEAVSLELHTKRGGNTMYVHEKGKITGCACGKGYRRRLNACCSSSDR